VDAGVGLLLCMCDSSSNPFGERTYLCKDTLCASLELVLCVGGEDAQPAVRVQVQDVPALPS
jgi:hypothetical protein